MRHRYNSQNCPRSPIRKMLGRQKRDERCAVLCSRTFYVIAPIHLCVMLVIYGFVSSMQRRRRGRAAGYCQSRHL